MWRVRFQQRYGTQSRDSSRLSLMPMFRLASDFNRAASCSIGISNTLTQDNARCEKIKSRNNLHQFIYGNIRIIDNGNQSPHHFT